MLSIDYKVGGRTLRLINSNVARGTTYDTGINSQNEPENILLLMISWQNQFFFKPGSQLLKRHVTTSNGGDDSYHGFGVHRRVISTSTNKQNGQIKSCTFVPIYKPMV